MNAYKLKLLFLLCFGAIIFANGSVFAFGSKDDSTLMKTSSMPKVTILPREISKTLDIKVIPTSIPTPLIIGTSWTCYLDPLGIDHCHQILVICDDDHFCTTVE